jgi:hypothetical protein
MNWASGWGKKDKKKKGKVEDAPAAKEPDHPVDDFSWGSFSSKNKKDAGAEEKEKEAEPVFLGLFRNDRQEEEQEGQSCG